MTTQQVRAAIKITDFWINKDGIDIEYTFDGDESFLSLFPAESVKALYIAGVIDDWKCEGLQDEVLMVKTDGHWLQWEQYALDFGMYQYAALLIVVNQELNERVRALAAKLNSRKLQKAIKSMGHENNS
jgi:hypothetical protein